MDALRVRLFALTARRWSIAGRQKDQEFVAEVYWHHRTYKPRLIVRRSSGPATEVGVNELSLAGHRKYMELSRAVQEWRRGKSMLPEGDIPFDFPTSTEESTA